MAETEDRFQQALRRFEEAHREDPQTIRVEGRDISWSLFYHQRLSYWVTRLDPQASEPLRLAAHCQHLRRWTIPRTDYPEGRSGYKQWRRTLARYHAREAGRILAQVGFPPQTIARLKELVQKVRLKLDPEVQLLEDAICLVFLENEWADFSEKHEESKLIGILQKTWEKMSPQGREQALALVDTLPGPAQKLIQKALASGPGKGGTACYDGPDHG